MTARNAATVFQVSNLDEALKHYIEVLGFSEDFRFGDYAGIKLGEVCLHLSGHSIHDRPVGGGTVYIFCDEVDTYYADIVSKGAKVKAEPRSYDYGMRDFVAVDLDGNHLGFGCPS
ncbi:MAG: VOC family protein [Verrucomicrobium sp.]